jgi:hypothetical protein
MKIETVKVLKIALLDIWQAEGPPPNVFPLRIPRPCDPPARGGKDNVRIVEILESEAELFEIVAALKPGGRFTDFLYRGQEQTDQDRNHGGDDKQFDETKCGTTHQGIITHREGDFMRNQQKIRTGRTVSI